MWRRAALYAEDKGSATTWIFAIARNLRIDRLRREVPWQELPEERAEQSRRTRRRPTRRWRRRSARCACGPRSPSCRPSSSEVVALSYIEGLSHGEIADAPASCRLAR